MDMEAHNDTSKVTADIEDLNYGVLSLTVGRDLSFKYLDNFDDLAANELRGIRTEEESPHVDEDTDGEVDDDHVHNFIMEIYFTEQSSKILIVSVESCSEEAVDNVPTVLALSNEKDEENELNELKRKLKAAEEKIEKLEDNNERQETKTKRKKTTVSKETRDKLFAHFHKFRKPTTKQLRKIAEELELPEKYVSDWFQNRRNEKVGREEIKPTCKCTPEQTKRHFTEAERDEMRALYNEDSHPNQEQMQEVANKFCLPKSKIAAWFCQHRNAKGATNKRPASLKINRKSN